MARKRIIDLTLCNFDYTVRGHEFIAVFFYNPKSEVSRAFDWQYERAAIDLCGGDHPISLARVDVSQHINKYLVIYYQICRDPTLKIFRDGGKQVEFYKGPCDTNGIEDCLRRLSAPFPFEIKNLKDAIQNRKIVIVGVFPDFSGRDYDTFLKVAEKLKWDYDFCQHLSDGGDRGPIIRLYNLFEDKERFVELKIKDLNVDAMMEFVKDNVTPAVILHNEHHARFVKDFFTNEKEFDQVLLFIKRGDADARAWETKYRDVANKNRRECITFMLADLEGGKDGFRRFRFPTSQVPVILIKNPSGELYAKSDLTLDYDIEGWLEDYKAGRLAWYQKLDPDYYY